MAQETGLDIMLSCCCFLFLNVFFLCSFLFACFLFSSLGPPQAAVPLGYPCSSVGHTWAAASPLPKHLLSTECLPPRTIFSPIPDNVPFHVPPPVSASVSPLMWPHISYHIYFVFSSHISPYFAHREAGTPLATSHLRKHFHQQELCWSRQKACPPGTQAVAVYLHRAIHSYSGHSSTLHQHNMPF